jgi:CAAX prenyl protease-like protein
VARSIGINVSPSTGLAAKYPALPYVAPFAVFIALMALEKATPISGEILYPVRVIVVTVVLVLFSRNAIDFRVKHAAGAIALGVAVFAIWIGPDALWPHYRSFWLFTNALTGHAQSSAPEGARSNIWFILFRSAGCVLLVPVIEELFWRGWLARWLIDSEDFRRVPLGAYAASSFWIGSALFASEHGPYWEVGLIAGFAYNWWMCRTRSLADCILSHAVTNGCLSIYVLAAGQWQYWL